MKVINIGEVSFAVQIVPTLVFLIGLIVLWTHTVFFKASKGEVITSPVVVSITQKGSVDKKRFEYYFHSYWFDSKSHSSLIKEWLLWRVGATRMIELIVNHETWVNGASIEYFDGMLLHSPIVLVMKLITLVFMIAVIIFADTREYGMSASTFAIIGTVRLFMILIVSSNNFIALYVAREGMSRILFVLTAQPKTEVSVESGIKYFFQSSFASAILLRGIALVFAGTQEFNFTEIRWVMRNEPLTLVTSLGFGLITVALLFKISAFPGHFWAVDAYRGPTASVLTMFAVVVKRAAFMVRFNVFLEFMTIVYVNFGWLIYRSSARSMLIGAVGAIRVINEAGSIRQFVAYTSINQVGFVIIGLNCMSREGFWASFMYIIVYLIASLRFLGIVSRIRIVQTRKYTNRTRLDELRLRFNSDLKFSRRVDLFVLAYAIWSMAGIPPIAGFFGKVGLWSSIRRKLDDTISGATLLEGNYSFEFIDISSKLDPFMLLAFRRATSVVVSVMSGVYYFKLYEIMTSSATTAQTVSYFDKKDIVMIHDSESIALTIIRALSRTRWIIVIDVDGVSKSYMFPHWVYAVNDWVTLYIN